MKFVFLLPWLVMIAAPRSYHTATARTVPGAYNSFTPGALWYDNNDSLINAHGGGILYEKGTYYWFGEKRGAHRSEGVNVYTSKDLYNWKYTALALTPDEDTASDIARGCVMERPKVLYNPRTKKYVMWFHLELRGQGYRAARAGVAVSDQVTGPYKFVNSFRPNGNMFRDMTLFADDDGSAYAIYASRDNYDMRMVRLSDDYLSATTRDSMLFSRHREAPALFKHGHNYYLYTSACTGWRPNKASLHMASSIWGPWQESDANPMLGNGADSTFGGQPSYVLPLPGKKNEFVFIADRWNPRDLRDSRYLFLPVGFRDNNPFVQWKDQWDLSDLSRPISSAPTNASGPQPATPNSAGLVAPHQFTLGDSSFLLDNRPFQIISGEMHYTRVPREAWRARMKMARAMGLNTIGTYVFWNANEPEKGKFDFSGNNDIAAFVRTAREEGLYVILRPSPYVCAEWEFGGYPYWLQKEQGLVVRSKEPQYLKEYKAYIEQIGKQLAPLQINHGGNILMIQIENEYGSYGSDKEYLDINRKMFIDAGFDGLLYTCDPPQDLAKGYLPGLLPAVNGTDRPQRIREIVRAHHDGKGPFFIAEWYPAWFDWWGTPHHTVAAAEYVHRLDSVLSAGISINMYMFHGGTTRGFMNGANYNDRNPYEPQISSYDYDAPLDEAGNPTPKFMEFRKVISQHLPPGTTLPDVPPARPAINTPAVKFTIQQSLLFRLPMPRYNEKPLSFEDLNQSYGYVLYRTIVDSGQTATLKIDGLRDYAVVFVGPYRVGTLDRRLKQDSLTITLPNRRESLDILVENMGRINFGPYLLQNKKGIIGKVELGGRELTRWSMYSLPFNQVDSIGLVELSPPPFDTEPFIAKGTLHLTTPGDTYLDMSKWGKGCVWINGHHLGRYWSIGPQQTLYVPAEWLHAGDNDVIILDILHRWGGELKGIDHPILSQLQ